MRSRAAALAALAALLLSACGSVVPSGNPAGSGIPGGSDTPSASTQSRCSVATAADPGRSATSAAPLAASAAPVAVIECTTETRPVAGDGTWSYVVEKRAAAGFEPLVAALRAPDEPDVPGTGCSLMLILLPWFALEMPDGTWVRPRIPTTACHDPQWQVLQALRKLSFTTVSATRTTQVETQAEVERDARAAHAGCDVMVKDMLAVEDSFGAPKPGRMSLGGSPGAVRVCHYRAGTDRDGSDVLTFLRGAGRVDPAAAAGLGAALASSRPLRPCTRRHTVVDSLQSSTGGWFLVELDGCHRVLDVERSAFAQATPQLLAALAAA